MRTASFLAALALAAATGFAAAHVGRAHAEPQPAFDRVLVERLIRAQEEQARSPDALMRVLERTARAQEEQTRALEALVRVTERCK